MNPLQALGTLLDFPQKPTPHMVNFNMATPPAGRAIPPRVIDGPNGPQPYLSTLPDPQQRAQVMSQWQQTRATSLPAPAQPTPPTLRGQVNPGFNPGFSPMQNTVSVNPQLNAFNSPQQSAFNPQQPFSNL